MKKISRKGLIIAAVVLIVYMGIVIKVDAWQQNRFAEVRAAYQYLSGGNFQEAEVLFEDYLNVNSELYWHLLEYFNGDEYSRTQVEEAIEKCRLECGVN